MEPIAMSHLGDVVWLSQDALCDPMGEFGAEADEVTRPVPGGSLLQRVAAVSRIAVPTAPPLEEPVRAAAEPALTVAEPVPVVASAAAARRGWWFVGVAVLALLPLGQLPFVVLWALQTANPPAPVAIQVTKPPVAFAMAPPVPVERTLATPPRPKAAP